MKMKSFEDLLSEFRNFQTNAYRAVYSNYQDGLNALIKAIGILK